MLARRIIPCLDVDAGRVKKEFASSNCVMPAIRWKSRRPMISRRRRDLLSRHHGFVRQPRHHAGGGAHHRRAGLPAAHRGRRRAQREDVRKLLLAGLTRPASTPRRCRSELVPSRLDGLWQPGHRGRSGRPAPARPSGNWEVFHPRRPQTHRHRRSCLVRAHGGNWAQGRSCSPAWIATARATASTWN